MQIRIHNRSCLRTYENSRAFDDLTRSRDVSGPSDVDVDAQTPTETLSRLVNVPMACCLINTVTSLHFNSYI